MQFKKPVISGLLAFTLLANLFIPSFAYNSTGSTEDRVTGEDTAQNVNTEYQETNNTSSETQVYATRSSTFTVLVPKTIILSGSTGFGQYVVGAKGDVLAEDSISIEPDSYNLTLYRVDDHTKETPATVTQGTTSVTGAQIEAISPAYATMEGSIQANGLKAGSWSTTMTFNIALNEETTKPFTVTADNKTELGVTDTTTNLDIPANFVDSNGDNREVVGIDDNAFYDNNNLEKVTIPGSVESIGDNAFADCDNLGRVEVADEVKEIGNNAFGGVDEVIYGGSATGSPWGANNVYESIDAIPSHIHTLEHVDRVEATEEAAGNIEYWHCTDCDKYYRDAGCTDEITLADTVIAQLPCNHNLTYISGKNYWYCDKCGKYFSDENGTNEIVMQDFVITKENRAKIGYTDTTTNLVIPDTFKDTDGTWYKVTEIGKSAFYAISNLKSVTLPETLTVIGANSFNRCLNLTSINIPDSVTIIGDNSFGYCEKLTSITFGNSVKKIGQGSFWGCNGLTHVYIPASVDFIGVDAFSICDKLTTIDVDLNNANYTSIDGIVFSKDQTELAIYPMAKSGTSYTIPETVITLKEDAFYEQKNLRTVTMGSNVKFIEHGVFCKASNLSNVTLNNGLLEVGSYAFNTTAITSITIPDTVTDIYNAAFANCKSLTSVKLPDGLEELADYTFSNCTSLTTIQWPSNLKIIGISKEMGSTPSFSTGSSSVFSNCTSLRSLSLPDGVTRIGRESFSGCTNLNPIRIPSSVTEIQVYAFLNVPKIVYNGSATYGQNDRYWGAKSMTTS